MCSGRNPSLCPCRVPVQSWHTKAPGGSSRDSANVKHFEGTAFDLHQLHPVAARQETLSAFVSQIGDPGAMGPELLPQVNTDCGSLEAALKVVHVEGTALQAHQVQSAVRQLVSLLKGDGEAAHGSARTFARFRCSGAAEDEAARARRPRKNFILCSEEGVSSE